MPELPEVETTRRGVLPYLLHRLLIAADIREPRLRWPIPADLALRVRGRRVEAVERRGKYLLIRLDRGTLLIHLGMSGSLRIVDADCSPSKHDHVDLILDSGQRLRYHDPRRFGTLLFIAGDPHQHALLCELGPEPLEGSFDGGYLYHKAQGRTAAIKTFLMNSAVVVGVGNIYASEALFLAGINPLRQAGRVSRERYDALAIAVRTILEDAITQGGTTLRDYVNGDGQPGYFSVRLKVYGRAGEPCCNCGKNIHLTRIGQRSTYYCGRCQR